MVPAAIAGVVVLLFLLLFKDKTHPTITESEAGKSLAASPVS
jgi:hypothetical protein